MKKINFLFIALIGASFFACDTTTSEKTTIKKEDDSAATKQACTYSFSPSQTVISFTAFKTSDKVAVGGKFNDAKLSQTAESENITNVFKDASFSINTSSVNTSNPDRDKKIVEHFFGSMMNTDKISGNVLALKDGEATLSITMNDSTQETSANYTIENETITLTGTIDVNSWGGLEAIASLNKVCDDLHKGADGISKLWSEVDIQIVSTLEKKCE